MCIIFLETSLLAHSNMGQRQAASAEIFER